ncbi:trypsin-like peptidase domain-containing protein [Anatilimnocola sp. NA78]|uniref:trypsin-like peptidase domain-containing protein n=1 Tax=Anatilimnocola sp. NA78 TaxID=3415683 RepID=UPI003CE44968
MATFSRSLILCCAVALAGLNLSAASGQSLESLKKAQEQTHKHLDKMLAATIGIHLEDSSGSGVIVSEDGYILTAAHVIAVPGDIFEIELSDGRKVKAKSLGMDHDFDAGMAKILGEEKWPFVEMAKQAPKPGDWCLATGHPGGIFTDRKPPLRLGRVLVAGDGSDPLEGIQTDATVYPGDSGGPLFNLDGEVVGIHSNIGYDVLENQHVPVEVYRRNWEDFKASKETGDPISLGEEDFFLFDFIPQSVLIFYDTIASWFTSTPDWYRLAKDSAETLAGTETITQPLKKTIIDVLADEVPVAMGVAVNRRGLVLTKASSLKGEILCVINEEPFQAKIVARDEVHDLALLQIVDSPRLKPVVWADHSPKTGDWLVTPDVDSSPLSLGIMSNAVCKIPGASAPRGAMKVEVGDAIEGGVQIKRVLYGGPAARAGMRVNDCVVEFDGNKIADAEALFKQMEKTKPGQEIAVKVKRAEQEMQFKLKLVLFVDEDEEYSGSLSERRGGFPAVFAHDTAIIPEACGSPVLDLNGKVVGLNIARAGRVTSYAIPADELKKVVPKLVKKAKRSEKKELAQAKAKAEAEKPMPASGEAAKETRPAVTTPAPMAP